MRRQQRLSAACLALLAPRAGPAHADGQQLCLWAPGPNVDDVRLHRLGRPLRPRLASREHEVSAADPESFPNLEVRAGRRGLEAALGVALEAQLALPSPVG